MSILFLTQSQLCFCYQTLFSLSLNETTEQKYYELFKNAVKYQTSTGL